MAKSRVAWGLVAFLVGSASWMHVAEATDPPEGYDCGCVSSLSGANDGVDNEPSDNPADCNWEGPIPLAVDPNNPGTAGFTPYYSMCWGWFSPPSVGSTPPPGGGSSSLDCLYGQTGFPLNLDLSIGAAPGEYPPITLDAVLGTCPLVGPPVDHYRGATGRETRSTVGGLVDAVTGVPLVRMVDFELPFGRSTYRHIRTYSQMPEAQNEMDGAYTGYAASNRENFWDWAGIGWMIGEAPILLVDASPASWNRLNEPNGQLQDLDDILQERQTRCILIPDAHTSIPFFRDDTSGRYEAPSRFDAVIDHDGVWDSSQDRWTTPPLHYWIWMQNQSVKYEFSVMYEDMPVDPDGDPWNDLDSGWTTDHTYLYSGRPYVALCTAIEDRYGQRVEIEYCGQKRMPCEHDSLDQVEGCVSCCQACQQKGQISTVKLRSGVTASDPGTIEWTIVYVYRDFYADVPSPDPQTDPIYWWRDDPQRAISAIYAYEGEPALSGSNCRTISGQSFFDISQAFGDPENQQYPRAIDAMAAMWALDGESEFDLPPGWRYRVKHLYVDQTQFMQEQTRWTELWPVFSPAAATFHGPIPLLLQTAVTTADPESMTEDTRYTSYRYSSTLAPDNFLHTESVFSEWWKLSAIYEHDTLEAIRARLGDVQCEMGQPGPSSIEDDYWPLGMLFLEHDARLPDPRSNESPVPCATHAQAATAWFGDWSDRTGGFDDVNTSVPLSERAEYYANSGFHRELVQDYLRGVPNDVNGVQPIAVHHGVNVLVDRSSASEERVYRAYRFLVLGGQSKLQASGGSEDRQLRWMHTPRSSQDSNPTFSPAVYAPIRSIYHEPYTVAFGTGFPSFSITNPSRGDPMWVCVTDEYDSVEDALLQKEDWTVTLEDRRSSEAYDELPLTRRVTVMNCAGYVLSEHVYDIRAGELGGQSGMWEEYYYDWQMGHLSDYDDESERIGRLVQRRSYGWSAAKVAAGTSEPSEGLVEVYRYYTSPTTGPTTNISSYGVGSGTPPGNDPYAGGWVRWLSQVFRHPVRDDLILQSIEFPNGATSLYSSAVSPDLSGLASPEHRVTSYGYDLEDSPTGDGLPESKRIVGECMVSPPVAQGPGETPLFGFEVTRHVESSVGTGTFYDTWRGYGSTSSASSVINNSGSSFTLQASLGATQRFNLDFDRKDYQGRVIAQVSDALESQVLPTAPTEVAAVVGSQQPTAPAGWARNDADPLNPTVQSTPLAHWTVMDHGARGPNEIWEHTGRKQSMRLATVYQGDVEQIWMRLYKNVQFLFDGTPPTSSECDGEIIVFENGQQTVRMDVSFTIGQTILGDESFDIEREIRPAYDASGRVTTFTLQPPGNSDPSMRVVEEIRYGRFGEVTKETTRNGTITRHVHDPRGRPLAMYRGTKDAHPYWGNSAPGTSDDNLVLLERNYYGTGPRDANRIVETRRYRGMSLNQYIPYGADGVPGVGATETVDFQGWPEYYEYDWQGRPLARIVCLSGDANGDGFADSTNSATGRGAGSPVRHEVSFLNELGEVVLTATYGSQLPSEWAGDIPTTQFGDTMPTAANLLATGVSVRPVRLTEYLYNARGGVEEVRTYETTSGEHNVSARYFDHENRVVRSIGSNGLSRSTYFDAKGSAVRDSRLAGTLEVTRSETVRDGWSNPVIARSYERLHDAASTPTLLSVNNAIIRERHAWFDVQGKEIASIDHGTGGPTFENYTIPARQATPPAWNDTTDSWDYGATLSSLARVNSYAYYGYNNKIAEMRDPTGMRTRYCYDPIGKIGRKIEDSGGSLQRITAYKYDHGQLERVGLWENPPPTAIADPCEEVPPWNAGSPDLLEASLERGSIVVAGKAMGSEESENNDVVSRHIEHGGTPESWSYRTIEFAYHSDGLIARRTDSRDVEMAYEYDELGNLVEVIVDDDILDDEPRTVKDRIDGISFQYDYATGELIAANSTSTVEVGGVPTTTVVSDNEFEYDVLGNLLRESQQHGAYVSTSSPAIDYEWAYSPASSGNYNRLTAMVYPNRAGTTQRRRLDFGYVDGVAGFDSALQHVTSIEDDVLGEIASFDYTGASRRVGFRRGRDDLGDSDPGNDVFATTWEAFQSAGMGYPGLSGFGQMRDLRFVGPSGATQHRYQYEYDTRGLRRWERVTQADHGGVVHDNQRSVLYSYDALMRLTEAKMGALDLTNPSQPSVGASTLLPEKREVSWLMDLRDNLLTRSVLTDTDGLPGQELDELIQTPNHNNEVSYMGPPPPGGPPATTNQFYDRAGNLILDQDYWYQYDAWGRLVQVSEKGSLTYAVETGLSGTPGDWIVAYAYDALGRLIRKQAPMPNMAPDKVRTERYYYDGVRRIQEVVTQPLVIGGGGLGAGSGETSSGSLEEGEVSLSLEEEFDQTGTGSSTTIGGAGLGADPMWTDREYVYTPGPTGAVDEFVCQIDRYGTPLYILQDTNLNVVGLVSESGAVLRQYTYDSYGTLLFSEQLGGHSASRIGHQGLFYDRFDAPATGVQLAPLARGVYLNRNRAYDPNAGRFLQSDPNASGLVILLSLGERLVSTGPLPDDLDLKLRFSDGINLFSAYRANPLNWTDPLGLLGGVPGMYGIPGGPIRSPFELLLDPELYPNSPNKKASLPKVNSSLVAIASGLGHMFGSMYAAWAVGDGVSDNPQLHELWLEQARRAGLPALAGRVGKGNGLPGVVNSAGGAVVNEVLQPGMVDFRSLAVSVFTELGQYGLEFVKPKSVKLVAPIAFGAGLYGGNVEYLAETAFDWWKK